MVQTGISFVRSTLLSKNDITSATASPGREVWGWRHAMSTRHVNITCHLRRQVGLCLGAMWPRRGGDKLRVPSSSHRTRELKVRIGEGESECSVALDLPHIRLPRREAVQKQSARMNHTRSSWATIDTGNDAVELKIRYWHQLHLGQDGQLGC